MRSFLTLFALFAALMLVIPTAAAAMYSSYDKAAADLEESRSVSESALSESEASVSTPKAIGSFLFDEFLILDLSSGRTESVSRIDYIRGALASEMPATYEQEALRAQAVAAHTRAVRCALSPDESLGGAYFSADPSNDEGYITKERFYERYGDAADKYWEIICSAADYAENRLLLYRDEPALCAYHAMSAGMTEDSGNVWQVSLPYLVPVESESDTYCDGFEEEKVFGTAQMRTMLSLAFPTAILSENAEEWISLDERSPSGYVTKVTVGGVTMHGQKLRTALSLRSTAMTLDYSNGVFTVTTKGYGHGVGLSQTGAEAMAKNGSAAEEILLHYYPGTHLTEL